VGNQDLVWSSPVLLFSYAKDCVATVEVEKPETNLLHMLLVRLGIIFAVGVGLVYSGGKKRMTNERTCMKCLNLILEVLTGKC
jgi:hypothetical protein